MLPPGSIADHIAFGGAPIYFPGILEDYGAQGGERWGCYPCLDDHFFFVHMAFCYGKDLGNWAFLEETVNGKPLPARLEAAYAMPPSREDTGLVYTEPDRRGVNFGFFDTTVHTGDLLFASLLKFRASLELAEIFDATGDAAKAAHYRGEAARIARAIPETFADGSGFLRASTGLSAQPDVWGTAFAVYHGVLEGETETAACKALAQALADGTIAWKGAIRHVPADRDYSETSAWETSYAAKNRYQNGAYWPTPVGWVAYAVSKTDPEAARALVAEYIAALREDDFRKGPEHGAPWECRHPDGMHRQNPVYLTSVTAPLAALQRMAAPATGAKAPFPEMQAPFYAIAGEAKAAAAIVLPATPCSVEEFAAEELRDYVRKISGAELPIQREATPGHYPIYIGAAAREQLAGFDWPALGPEGFLLRSGLGGAYIAGQEALGALYGVYTLLERFGVRWFMPGATGEVVPSRADLQIGTLDETQTPSFTYRWVESGDWGASEQDERRRLGKG